MNALRKARAHAKRDRPSVPAPIAATVTRQPQRKMVETKPGILSRIGTVARRIFNRNKVG